MPTAPKCAKCGVDLPDDHLEGFCLRCLTDAIFGCSEAASRESFHHGPASASATQHPPSVSAEPAARTASALGDEATDGQIAHRQSKIQNAFPRRLGDYELLEEIARGGMGVVYKARQVSLNRIVAVKLILSGPFASDQFIRRFRAEAAAAARLQHPNIVAIHEVGEHNGRHFFSMEYVEGRNLAEAMRGTEAIESAGQPGHARASPNWEAAARLMATIAEAVHYAHQRGIIHCDLKPSNILIDARGQPHITDFGLAKLLDSDPQLSALNSQLTLTGQVLGSPNYLSPEQAAGKRAAVGVPSDVYAMGAVLYHLMTGRPPFVAETIQETLLQVMNQEPVPPRLLNPGAPPDLETICLKCLEKEPAQRYRTAQEMAEELDRFLTDEPILARPVTRSEKTWRWCRRNPVVSSLGSATLILLLGVAVGSPIALFRIQRESVKAQQNAEDRRQELVRLNVANGLHLVSENNPLAALPWLIRALELEEGRPEREAIHRLRLEFTLRQCPKLVHLLSHERAVDAATDWRSFATVQFSGDSTRVLTIHNKEAGSRSPEGEVIVWSVLTGQPLFPPLRHPGPVYHAEFSRDGRYLVTACGVANSETDVLQTPTAASTSTSDFAMKRGATVQGQTRVWDAMTGEPVTEPLLSDGTVYHASFSLTGERIAASIGRRTAAGSLDGEAQIRETLTGRLLFSLGHSNEVALAAFTPDGLRLLTVSVKHLLPDQPGAGRLPDREYSAQLWDAKTGQSLKPPRPLPGTPRNWTFNRGQTCILTTSDSPPIGEACLIDVASGDSLIRPINHNNFVVDATFSSGGSEFVTASWDNSALVWKTATGAQVTPRLMHALPVAHASFSPDGHLVATASFDRTARIWDAYSGRPDSPPFLHNDFVLHASFSPDKKFLLTRSRDSLTRLWSLTPSSDPFRTLPHKNQPLHVEFSPNSRYLRTDNAGVVVRLRNVASRASTHRPLSFAEKATHAALSPDGRQFATTGTAYFLTVWEVAAGQPIGPSISTHESPSGVAGVRNTADGRLLYSLKHDATVHHVEFSRDGRCILTVSVDQTARVWAADSGQPLGPPVQSKSIIFRASLSPDGRYVLTAGYDPSLAPSEAQIWETATGKFLGRSFHHQRGIRCAVFSPDARRIATASDDGTARVWDPQTAQPITPPLQHQGPVYEVAFSPDGRLVGTAAADRTARLWDATTGEPVTPPLHHPLEVWSIAFSSDGRFVATGCDDGKARIWKLVPYGFTNEELGLLSHVLSSHQVDRAGTNLEPLSSQTIRDAWHKLGSRYARLLAESEQSQDP